jgi:N-methylhydantoinase B
MGGQAGAAAVVTLTTPDGKSRNLPCKGAFQAPAGSVIDMITPGSGGFGASAERAHAALCQDLLDGYVTLDGATRDYGVGNPDELLAANSSSED